VFVVFVLLIVGGESLGRLDFLLIPLVVAGFVAAFTWKPTS
jgi:hypothetical protein